MDKKTGKNYFIYYSFAILHREFIQRSPPVNIFVSANIL